MRERTRSVPGLYVRTQGSILPGGVRDSSSRIFESESSYENVLRPEVSPQKMINGWRSATPWSVSKYTRSQATGNYGYFETVASPDSMQANFDDFSGDLNVPYHFRQNSSASMSDNYNALVIKNLLKVRDQKANFVLAAAEMHKSIDTVTSAATRLFSAYSAARKGNFAKAAKALNVSGRRGKKEASTWLELQYGWLPMLSDVKGAYDEMTRITRNTGMLIKVKSRHEESSKTNDGSRDFGLWGSYQLSGEIQRREELILWYQVRNPYLLAASAVGVINPLEVAWELVPWSFAIDWFLPIGDYLGALGASSGLTFLSGTYTQCSNADWKADFSPKPPSVDYEGTPNQRTRTNYGTFSNTASVFQMNRAVLQNDPSPRPPSFKNPFSVGHALNAIALLRSLK